MSHNDRRYCPSTSHLPRIAAVLTVIVLLSGVGGAVNTITFNASQTIDFDITTTDLGTYNQTGLNLHNNDLYNFFAADQCTGSEVVSEVYSNGSYACTDISTYDTDTDDQNLSEVLAQGNVANNTIDMDGNDILKPDELRTGDRNIVVRDSSNGQDIARFNEGGNVEVPNGRLGVGTSPNSRLDLDAGSVSNYDTLAQFSYSDDSGDEQPLEVMAANTSENTFEDMFALRYYLRGSKDGTYSGINFHRGGSYRGEYLSFDTNGTQAMQIDSSQNVDIPNGNLLASGSSSAGETALSIESSDGESLDFIETSSGAQNNIALQNPDGVTVFRWPDSVSTTWVTTDLEMRSNSKIRTGRNSGSETGFYDSQNSQNILLAKEGGNVQIPNGNLNMSSNAIQNIGSSQTSFTESGQLNLSDGTEVVYGAGSRPSFSTKYSPGLDGGSFVIREEDAGFNSFYIEDGTGRAHLTNDRLDLEGRSAGLALNIESNGDISLGRDILAPSNSNTRFKTGGGGSNKIAIYDKNNSQEIATFTEGGNVQIPNGGLTVDSTVTSNRLHTNVVGTESFSNLYLDVGDNTGSILLRDANNDPIIKANHGGNVEIPNGNLDVSGQFSTGSTNCGTNEYIGGDGGCKTDSTGTDDQTLSEVLSQGNSAGSSNIDLNSNNIRGIGNLYSSAGLDIYSGAGGRILLRSRGSGGVLGWYDDYNNRWVQKYNNGGDLLLDPVGNVKLRIADLDMGGNSITGTDSLEFDGGIEAGTGAVTTGRSDQTAVGNGANATGTYASAFGYDASASQIYASAVGYGADATAGSALAVGYDTSASASSASAFGSYADASADSALAVGRDTSASADSALAVGSSAYASADSASAVGYGAYASASYASAFGSYADATAEGAVAIGYAANAPNQYEATFGNLGNQYRGGPLDVNITGNLTVHENLEVYGGTKNFVQQVNESHEVVYTSSESSEAVVEWSNVTTVEDDGTRIAFPPHLDLVMSDVEDFHVYATPVESLADVGVFNKTDTGFTLKASSPTQVDFHLRGVRKGYEDKPVVRRRK